jgi:signal transduction histidine kinase
VKQEDEIVDERGSNFVLPHQPQDFDDKAMQRHKKFPLLVYVGSAVSILLVIIIGALALYFSEEQKNKEQWVEHSYMVLENVALVHQGLYEMAINRHGYNTSGVLRFLKEYNTSSIAVDFSLNTLNGLVKDNPKQSERIDTLRRKINSLLYFWQTPSIAAKTVDKSATRAALVEKTNLDGIGASIDNIAETEHRLLVQREDSSRVLKRRTDYAIIIGTLMILFIVSFLIYFTLGELKYRILAYQKENEMSRLKSSFVSLASHEFRTPLSSILLSASLVEKYGSVHKDDNILKHANKIKGAVYSLKGILEDFLSLEKLNAGKVKARSQSFDLVKLCEDIAEELSTTLTAGQQLFYEHKGIGSVVILDENLLKNAIINLVTNAVKYAGDGATIELTTDVSGDCIIVTVKDNGVGINEKDQKKLFSPFYRINHNGKIPGTGLGLNIVQRYVNLMNGKLAFMSKPNEETSFKMSFPFRNELT